jgi:ABC-type nitrate/sulfonate/bicarbonate transport system permease component
MLPSAIPSIFTGLRITAATAITMVIFSEMMASQKGLGYLLTAAQQVLNTPQLFVVIIIVTILSVILVSIVNLLEYILCHRWKPQKAAARR